MSTRTMWIVGAVVLVVAIVVTFFVSRAQAQTAASSGPITRPTG